MLKTSFTKLKSVPIIFRNYFYLGLLSCIFLAPGNVMGQCYLACNGLVQVSLDQNCQAVITPAMMLNDTLTTCPGGQFRVVVLKYKKAIPTSPIVTSAEIGQVLQVEVTDLISGNKCWGDITVEDKLAPIIGCVTDTIPCYRAARFNVFAIDNCGLDTIIRIDEIINPYNCHALFVKQLIRRYTARDNYGNQSAICSDTTYLSRFDTARAVCPKDWSLANNCPISCKDITYNRIPLDKNGHPHPNYTGVPVVYDTVSFFPLDIDTLKLYPITDIYCNIGVTYEDIDLGVIGCVHKIMRMWTIREWHCSGEIRKICLQILEIVDREAPYVHCAYDFTATTDGGYKCESTVTLPPAIIFDSCGGAVRVDIVYPGGILLNKNGGVVKLPVGVNRIVYRAYDKCYNVDSCILFVTVEDRTAPVAICDRETVVALSIYGKTHVYATTFDDGSYDDCHIDSFLVRRMDNGAPCQINSTYFKPYVEVCCEDVGKTITVIFRVKDKHGNYNDCMVLLEVQDKIRPSCNAPIDLTIPCDYHFDINNLSIFGVMQRDSALFNNKRIIRYKGYDWTRDSVLTFHDGFAHDNCDFTITHSFVDNRNQCNVGDIIRTWVVSDRNGSDTCRQRITFFNFHPFNFDSIIWPQDTTLYGCLDADLLTPEFLKLKPRYPGEDKCDLVGQTYEDHVFRIVNGSDACFKIIRKWKVIDWCQFTYGPAGYVYDFRIWHQTIKIHNLDDPIIVANLRDTTFCTLDSCTSGPAVLTATATDSCTPTAELVWEYLIDFDRNGIYDVIRNGVGGTIDASGRYPLGDHTIKYVFEDKCGNKVARERNFSIRNCKLPSPYCLNGVAISLMPMDTNRDGRIDLGMVDVWASDVDQGSKGACGNPVVLSFSSDTSDRFRRFTCATLGQQIVRLYVTDAITGFQDFCITFVDVQDNSGACRTTITGGTIDGLVTNQQDNNTMNGVSVELFDNKQSNNIPMSTLLTIKDGKYAFTNMPFNNGDYTVKPGRNNDYLNGVSTADIIKIQRHILAFEVISNPYAIIAADVSNDKIITSRDILELRKLILGSITAFSNNTSWKFLDAGYKFTNVGDEVLHENYPQNFIIKPFNKDMKNVNFKGVKIGDVSGNAAANMGSVATSRDNQNLILVTNEQSMQTGNQISLPIALEKDQSILGFQFTLSFDPAKLQFEDLKSAVLPVGLENLGIQRIGEGLISFSWNTGKPLHLISNQPLFYINLKALSTGHLSNSIQINSIITSAVAFDESLAEMNIQLGFRTANGEASQQPFVLYQNQPNPFSDLTIIGFDMPVATPAVVTIYDLNSKVLLRKEINAAKGYNQFEITNSELGVAGVLFYQLDAAGYSATRRMVVIQ